MTGYEFCNSDLENFSGGFKSENSFWSIDHDRHVFTGFSFGAKGAQQNAKIYDKLLEVNKRNSADPRPFYSMAALETDEKIWCIEFSYRKKYLLEFGPETPEFALENLSELWRMSCDTYLVLKEKKGDCNLSRRKTSEFWLWLAEVWGESKDLVKKEKEIPVDDEKVYDHHFNKIYRSTKVLSKMTMNGRPVNVRSIVDHALKGEKLDSKKLK